MTSLGDHEVSTKEEIENVFMGKPHVLLLGAGASKAALPNNDKNGKPVPLLCEVAGKLNLVDDFPENLKDKSIENFELAYSELHKKGDLMRLESINNKVHEYFSQLELPNEPNLYDVINLSLREKDVIATFNWDPFLLQSRIRLAKLGFTTNFPRLIFLHGNVMTGFCEKDNTAGLKGNRCSKCGRLFEPSKLLYPVTNKNYQNDVFIKNQWKEIQYFIKNCLMFTIFGYSAPETDKEAISLLKAGWGDVNHREMEQTEVINKKGSNHEELEKTWKSFMHTHHYDIVDSFYESFIANHPRRSIEAYWNQYWEAKWISNNQVPSSFEGFEELKTWYMSLLDAERKHAIKKN